MSTTLILVQILNGLQLGILLFLIAAGLTLVTDHDLSAQTLPSHRSFDVDEPGAATSEDPVMGALRVLADLHRRGDLEVRLLAATR